MSPEAYIYWLQGMFDTIGDRQPTEAEWAMLRDKNKDMFGQEVTKEFERKCLEQEKQMALQFPPQVTMTGIATAGSAKGAAIMGALGRNISTGSYAP